MPSDASARTTLPQAPTGIGGLDDVTPGGLPADPPALACGAPGLYVPRQHGPRQHAMLGNAPRPGEPSEAARARPDETVLVIDDEPAVRMLVSMVLEDLGYTAIEAADGRGGLEVLRSGVRVDLLVTDVGLPGGLDGRQVAATARVMRPALKVLFITGHAEDSVLGHGRPDPGMHVLTKPFAMHALASRIRELVTAA